MAVRLTVEGAKALIVIDRPEVRNAMDFPAYEELAAHWRRVRDDPAIQVAVITGVGVSFCSGADLKNLIPRITGDKAGQARPPGETSGNEAVLRENPIYKPIIAAVNGFCVASGMEMLLGTDIRVASDRASFGLPEVCRGLFAAGGSTVRLPRQVPFVHAMDILLTGRRITAQEALQMGLVNCVVPHENLMSKAMEYADLIVANSPNAVARTKESVMRGRRMDEEAAFIFEKEMSALVFGHTDAIEGPKAFLEKRPPGWSD